MTQLHVDDARGKIQSLADAVVEEFAATRRILSFDEWFDLLCKEPTIQARSAGQFVLDAFEHFGRRDVRTPSGQIARHRLFDCEFDGWHRLVGQEEAQNELFEVIAGFVRLGRVNKTVLLHGPNGSAKSTMLESLQRALEVYSRTDRGALYRFAWVFPNRRQQSGGIGFGHSPALRDALGEETFARLSSTDIDARLVDETKDHPIYLIPIAARRRLLEDVCAAHPDFVISDAILYGELSHRNRKIYDALLTANQGDLRKVLQHVQIERFFVSRQYRQGLVTVEPKQTVDARSFPVTGDAAFAHLPPTVGGQALYAVGGDLVDANRGVINFSDLLKRPYEHYKYLLTATETGRVALDHVMLGLDMVLCGSANDLDLLEFRVRSGEYQSFRARLELIRVPFLLDYRVERKIYQEQVGDILRGVHVAPHVTKILALWGVMTRLRRPKVEGYSTKLKRVLERLTPIEKGDLYAYGRVPRGLSSEEARELLAAVPSMHQEKFAVAFVRAEGSDHILGDYEGSFGASVRDLKGVLLAAAAEPGTTAVTMPKVFGELRTFLSDAINHRWMLLNQDGNGFHLLDGDERSITGACWQRWLDLSDWEIREALGLVDEARYMDLFRKYVIHVSHSLKKERLFDPVTGELTDPDEKFMRQLEKTMAPDAGPNFRADVLSRVGAWALSHPNEDPAYHEIFPDNFALLREDYYKKQKDAVRKSIVRMLELLIDRDEPAIVELERVSLTQAEEHNARHALETLLGAHDGGTRRERHTRETLRETLVHLIKARY
jgi:serine protein kinase